MSLFLNVIICLPFREMDVLHQLGFGLPAAPGGNMSVNSPWYKFKMSWLCVYVCSSCRKPSRWREKGTGSILQAASKNQSLLDSSTPTPPAKAWPRRPTEVRDSRAARSSRDPHRTRVPNQRTAPTSALRRMSRPRQTRLLLLRKVKRSVQTCRH